MQKLATWTGLTLALGLFVTSCKKDTDQATTLEGNSITANAETAPLVQRAVTYNIAGNSSGYYEALPARYSSTTIKYPLIISVHGAGELGNGTSELYKVAGVGLPKRIADKTFPINVRVNNVDYSFIVISPQFRSWPSPVDIRSVIDYAKSKYRVDVSRIYLTGLSMGGGVCWDYAGNFGNVIAAVAPMAGAYSPSDNLAQKIANFRLPVWTFHNQDDNVVPYTNATGWVSKINARGANPQAKLTLWATGGHDSWTKATDPNFRQDGKNLYEWMLTYRR